MVAHLLKLRLLVLKNTLLRSPWQLVAVIFGGVYGLGLLVSAGAGLFFLSRAPVDLIRTVTVLGGSILVLGWILIPLLASGIDATLAPDKLRTFPIPLNKLLLGLFISGVLGVPGIMTLLLALATIGTWWQYPLLALAAMICSVIAAATCVVGSRMVVSLAAMFFSGRRFREMIGLIALVLLLLSGPIIGTLTTGFGTASFSTLASYAEVLSWTPLGAVWAVPAELALGHGITAGAKFLIAVATLVATTWLWRHSLAAVLVTPPHSTNRHAGTVARAGKLGLFARMPGTPAGAVAARCLTYWMRDPRYGRQLTSLLIVPAVMVFYSILFDSTNFLVAIGPFVALTLSLTIFSDVSYDSTAFAAHLASGIRGIDDRIGRVVAVSVFALPITLLSVVVPIAFAGTWVLLPAILGLSIGLLLSGLGLSSVTSATIVMPVPAPGENPFASRPGGGFSAMVSTFATWGILSLLVLPEIALFVTQLITGQQLWGWLTLLTGIALGIVFLGLGVRRGGSRLDVRGVDLFESLQRQR